MLAIAPSYVLSAPQLTSQIPSHDLCRHGEMVKDTFSRVLSGGFEPRTLRLQARWLNRKATLSHKCFVFSIITVTPFNTVQQSLHFKIYNSPSAIMHYVSWWWLICIQLHLTYYKFINVNECKPIDYSTKLYISFEYNK